VAEVERKLAAILSADVVGYSRLMAEDEAATVRALTDNREAISMLVGQHRGRVVDSPGDNLLAEFPTATDAVSCAVEIQGVLEARNAQLPVDRKMQFRIGVHSDEVRAEGERLYGDGVNIAARLEGLAEPGGICVSRTVHEQVRHRLELSYDDLGDQEVKNIPEPVRAYRVRPGTTVPTPTVEPKLRPRTLAVAGLVLILVVAGLLVWRLPTTTPSITPTDEQFTVPGFGGRPAIAVLPFDNLSGDPEQEYFADGIAEDLITRLSSWRRFPVIARNSSFTYKGQAVDVQQVGRELGARYVVEGSVRRAGNRVRISGQLIDATTGAHIWAETYDRELRDIFEVQDSITEAVSMSLRAALGEFEIQRVARTEPRNPNAYETNLRGLWHRNRFTKEDNAKARSLFREAAELDSGFAAPLCNLAVSHYWDIFYQWTDSPARSAAELNRNARACVAVNPEQEGGQMAFAMGYILTGQRDKTISAFESAIQLNPSVSSGYLGLGLTQAITGRPDEALVNLEKGMRLSPRDPVMWFFFHGKGLAHFAAGRYQDAVHWAQQCVQRRPGFVLAYVVLAASHAHLSQLDDARTALQEALRVQPDLSRDNFQRTAPIVAPDFVDRLYDGLRKAGLKE
jgi:adenylate cyclase